MRISFCCTGTKAAPWVDGLREAMPDAEVSEWQPGAPPADHGIVWAPPQQFIDEQPSLKAIFNIGAGVDALLKLRLSQNLVVVRIDDGGMAVQMAEYVSHAVIRHFREFDVYDREVDQHRWAFRKPQQREDFPVGIMGLGVLGARVAQALLHFEFPVLGWSRTPKELPGVRCFAGSGQFDDFLSQTRILVCLLPLTSETQGIINRRTLARLLPGGYVINAARGSHVVDEDLLAALDEGRLAGATLDVFRTEPLPQQHRFWTHPKVHVTPHTSARTLREESIVQITGKIRAFERGEPVAGVVNRERGY